MNVTPDQLDLPREGREPAQWQLSVPVGAITSVDVQLTRSGPWVAADWANGTATLLVRGPGFVEGDGVASQLVAANCVPRLRARVGTAYVIRHGGPIFLV